MYLLSNICFDWLNWTERCLITSDLLWRSNPINIPRDIFHFYKRIFPPAL